MRGEKERSWCRLHIALPSRTSFRFRHANGTQSCSHVPVCSDLTIRASRLAEVHRGRVREGVSQDVLIGKGTAMVIPGAVLYAAAGLLPAQSFTRLRGSLPKMCTEIPKADGDCKGRYRNPTVRPAWYRSRQRSITPAQRRAERELWPTLGLRWEYDQLLDLPAAFGRDAPTVLEIGCGTGEALSVLAAARLDHDFVGVDWYRGGVASSMQRLKEANLTNARLIRGDAATLLEAALPAEPLFDEVCAASLVFALPFVARKTTVTHSHRSSFSSPIRGAVRPSDASSARP